MIKLFLLAEILENIWTEYKNSKEENHAIDKVYICLALAIVYCFPLVTYSEI